MIISSIKDHDKKRKRISLDDGRLIFLLYQGEVSRLRLREGQELTEQELTHIFEDILKPRVRRRALYYLRSSDKTERQVRQKLREGLYPEELIDHALDFLKEHGFVDDVRYADSFVEAKRGKASKREIIRKLRCRGLCASEIERVSEAIGDEEEYEVCKRTFLRYTRGRDVSDPRERARAWRYLMSKGYGADAIEHAFRSEGADREEG